ncbi:MAG: hypothetical protein ABSG73_15525 [Candidatus Aminicenantales bacterium]|jgi:hypothetical protein
MSEKIYTIIHRDPSFRGSIAGVDFYGGKGTTNSLMSAAQCVKGADCTIEDPGHAAEVQAALGSEAEGVKGAAESKATHEKLFQESAALEHARTRKR